MWHSLAFIKCFQIIQLMIILRKVWRVLRIIRGNWIKEEGKVYWASTPVLRLLDYITILLMINIIRIIQYLSFRIYDSLFSSFKKRIAFLQSHRLKKRNWIQVWWKTNKSLYCKTFVTLLKKVQVTMMKKETEGETIEDLAEDSN